jgi:hypothetical protein
VDGFKRRNNALVKGKLDEEAVIVASGNMDEHALFI